MGIWTNFTICEETAFLRFIELWAKQTIDKLIHDESTEIKHLSWPVWLWEALTEDVLKLLHDVIHMNGDQTAILL